MFFFQAEDGIRDLVRSRGLGDVYKRQAQVRRGGTFLIYFFLVASSIDSPAFSITPFSFNGCLLYTSDAADERSSVDLGGRRIIKKKKIDASARRQICQENTNRCKKLVV